MKKSINNIAMPSDQLAKFRLFDMFPRTSKSFKTGGYVPENVNSRWTCSHEQAGSRGQVPENGHGV